METDFEKIKELLNLYFGYNSFRDGQKKIIKSIIQHRDVLAILPTGAGKSICYQIPSLIFPGITIVFSPLISLMENQVETLKKVGIEAAYINSFLTKKEAEEVMDQIKMGKCKIVYIAPEKLRNETFLEFLKEIPISMVTIDEAHCITEWGFDFRPSYLRISKFLKSLPERPIMSAVTATATEDVRNNIKCILSLKKPKEVVKSFDRKNLYFSVEYVEDKIHYIYNYILSHPGETGIIYCTTRGNVNSLSKALKDLGIPNLRYHAGLLKRKRIKNQKKFFKNKKRIIIATNAFGMGIDKPDVRFVLHFNMPLNMERYYQEAGRAGRDANPPNVYYFFP